MYKVRTKLHRVLKKNTQENSKRRKLIMAIHKIFQLTSFKIAMPIIFTTSIGLEAKFLCNSYKIIVVIPLTLILYLIYSYFNSESDKYEKGIVANSIFTHEILRQFSKVTSSIAFHKHEVIEKISKSSRYIPSEADFESICYQQIAFKVCKGIYDVFYNVYGIESVNVTMFHKFNDDKNDKTKEYIQMVAFANTDSRTPSSKKDKYFLSEKPVSEAGVETKDFFHKEIYRKNENAIIVLANKKEIDKNFKINKKCETREKEIKQYIAIPVFCEEDGILSLLQIDVAQESFFGEDESSINQLANLFTPFSHLLLMNFYRDYIIRWYSSKIQLLSASNDFNKEKASEYKVKLDKFNKDKRKQDKINNKDKSKPDKVEYKGVDDVEKEEVI